MRGRYHRVWVVFRKELLDTLRDRRTLMAMVVVPVVLYPILMLVMVEALRSEKGRREAQRYQICVPDESHASWLTGVLARAEAIDSPTTAPSANDDPSGDFRARVAASNIAIHVLPPGESMWDAVMSRRFHLGVIVDPPPMRIPATQSSAKFDPPNRVVQLIYSEIEPLSEFAFGHMRNIMDIENGRIVHVRLDTVSKKADWLDPIQVAGLSTASPDQQYAKILAAIVPFLLVIMTVTGAMYPAIDLTAGERERGTLETLAVSPVPVGQIVAGKFGVVIFIAMLSTALNLGSMTAMVHFTKLDKIVAAAGDRGAANIDALKDALAKRSREVTPTAQLQKEMIQKRLEVARTSAGRIGLFKSAAPVVLLAMLPFAVLFSGVMLAACSFARTFKEAQNYMMPVMMCAVIPSMIVSYMPSIKLTGLLLVTPVANMVLLIRELFLGNWQTGPLMIAILSNCLYAAAAVAVAAKVYGAEAVLFSDVGSYRTLLRRRYLRPRSTPSASMALLTVALIFPAYFYAQQAAGDPNGDPGRIRITLMLSQLLFIAAPAIFIAWYTRCDLRETFSLRAPDPIHAIGALLMAISAWPVSTLIFQIQAKLTGLDDSALAPFAELQAVLTSGPLWAVVLALAVFPAICEELLFRGLLTSGLRTKLGVVQTIVVVGFCFGLYHVIVEKMAVTILLGIVLTLVCIKTRSIYAAMLVHIGNNALAIMASRLDWLAKFYGADGDSSVSIRFDLRTALFVAAFTLGLAMILLRRLTRRPGHFASKGL